MTAITERKEASAFNKFRLLMWKNFLQQWRHPIRTAVELILPILALSIMLALRWYIEPSVHTELIYPSFPAHALQNSSLFILKKMDTNNFTGLSIAYSPTSPELEDVVTSGIAKMLARNFEDYRDFIAEICDELPIPDLQGIDVDDIDADLIYVTIKEHVARNIRAYDKSDDLKDIYVLEETTLQVLAAVEFDDSLINATAIPKNISYALRFPERPRMFSMFSSGGSTWNTDSVFPSFQLPGPRSSESFEGSNDPGYVNEMFIALQYAISSELISRITGEDLTNFDIEMRRYPHPPYIQDMCILIMDILLPLFLMLTFSYTAVNIVRAVTVEKELQLKETMKIMGLPTWLHWTAWFCKQFIYLFILSIFIVILIKMNWFTNKDGFSEYAVITKTPWHVMLFIINLYFTCTICFCFMLSGFFSKGSTAALFTGVAWFMSNIPAALISLENGSSSFSLQAITCLSVNCVMTYGLQLILAQESSGGVHWGSLFDSPSTESSRFSLGTVIVFLVVDICLYMLIALYLEQVMPGPFGTPKRWNFLFTKDFWMYTKTNIYAEDTYKNDSEDTLKEKDPKGLPVGVRINNLTKIFGSNIAVNHLTLNIFEDQITVLLGHNGAGKSTTISMLTGNLEASFGTMIVAGYDVTHQPRAARAHLGLCPQHDVLFDELTVREHLEFFARLKGFEGKALKDDIDTLITKLELQDKSECLSADLSGGQKRRLCVGIALSGAARVVLLDEPTSGMDPASRRALWDLLEREKKGRAIILTTHFMDEADYLGDRIAIMAHGRLQCVGSPHFLKRNHGAGYRLVIGKDDHFNYEACLNLIHRYIPGTTIKDDRGSEITFSLLNEHAPMFETMLEDLENNISVIRYKNYGLIATTLEDVFMSLGADLAPVQSESDDGATTVGSQANSLDQLNIINELEQKVTGFRLIIQHFLAMWLKLFLYWSRSWGVVLVQLTVPVILINISLVVTTFIKSFTKRIVRRHLSLNVGYAHSESLLSTNTTTLDSIGALAATAYETLMDGTGVPGMSLTNVGEQDIEQYYLERAVAWPAAMGALRHSMLVGATFSDSSATAWFSNFGYHDVGTSLAAVQAALLRSKDAAAELRVYNHPLTATYANQSTDVVSLSKIMALQLSNGIGSSVAIVSAVFIMFYIREKASGAKLLQKAAGLQPAVLWLSAAAFDWLWFLVLSLSIVASCSFFSVSGLSSATELGRLYLCFMVYGAAMVPLNYLLSHFFKSPAVGFGVVFYGNVLIGMMGVPFVQALSKADQVATNVDMILQFFPMYSLVTSLRELNQVAMTIDACLGFCESMGSLLSATQCNMTVMCDLISHCCVREHAELDWEKPGILRYLLMTLVSGAMFWALLMIVEYRIFYRLFTYKRTPPPVPAQTVDSDVRDEEFHVKHIDRANLPRHGLVASGLTKYYGKHLAVDQVSFSVNDSECFGLLGVNGAGKTTTFKMLMGDESISSGAAFVSGHSVERELTAVHSNIGYCPQFDALFNELTGRETMRLFSLLRGLSPHSTDLQATTLATSLGFLKHLDKRVAQYSGGTKRKLNTAVAFLGNTRLVFVDEPTTGVDPAAKRHVWRAIRSQQKGGKGVVLTSHSMEECEALCSRLTIMVNGRFQCLGTPQHLKNKFSQGFTLTIKLKTEDRSENRKSTMESTEAVKHFVNKSFNNPKIMEEYQGMLTYYLADLSMAWSAMFGVMERAKRDLGVEYYSISQTTLEQIFLQFTKYQREAVLDSQVSDDNFVTRF